MAQQKKFKKSRIKYFLIVLLLLAVAVAGVFLFLWVRDEYQIGQQTAEAEEGKLYSASRYFCRVRHPDNWDVEQGDNGFYMDKATGKIFRLYPFDLEQTDYGVRTDPPNGTPAPTAEPVKVPVADVNIYVYYQDNPNFIWPTEKATPKGATPSPAPKETPDPTPTVKPYPMETACENAIEAIRRELFPEAPEGTEGDETPKASALIFDLGSHYSGRNVDFTKYTYEYVSAAGVKMNGELYVCTRALAYYFIRYEAPVTKFSEYRRQAEGIIDTFQFSIFDL